MACIMVINVIHETMDLKDNFIPKPVVVFSFFINNTTDSIIRYKKARENTVIKTVTTPNGDFCLENSVGTKDINNTNNFTSPAAQM